MIGALLGSAHGRRPSRARSAPSAQTSLDGSATSSVSWEPVRGGEDNRTSAAMIVSSYGVTATRVQLLVDSLDSSGQIVAAASGVAGRQQPAGILDYLLRGSDSSASLALSRERVRLRLRAVGADRVALARPDGPPRSPLRCHFADAGRMPRAENVRLGRADAFQGPEKNDPGGSGKPRWRFGSSDRQRFQGAVPRGSQEYPAVARSGSPHFPRARYWRRRTGARLVVLRPDPAVRWARRDDVAPLPRPRSRLTGLWTGTMRLISRWNGSAM